ncbi:MAG: hypothetical protein ACYC7L_01025 [Nitrospirota bacterium]
MKTLETIPPFIWPEARFHAEQGTYADEPPSAKLLKDTDLISGLIVGATDGTIKWLNDVLKYDGKQRICIVLALFPAGPTRSTHLKDLLTLRDSAEVQVKELDIRVLPIARSFGLDCEKPTLPPTVIQAHNSGNGHTVMSIGSVGDAGRDPLPIHSLNFVFRPDDALRDAWRKWFQYVFSRSYPLSENTCNIPHLVPAKGDPEATRLWEEYEHGCKNLTEAQIVEPVVDAISGEVVSEGNGNPAVPWDEGKTALDPLANVFQQVYANGWLVTVDESTRIKPLTIPVKAMLLGQQSQTTVGAVTQKQAFSLRVLDVTVDKEIEKCRKVTDVMDILTVSLSSGNRWLSEAGKGLLEKELEARNKQGMKMLIEALGGTDVGQFIGKRSEDIRKDLNSMYKQLGQGDVVPADKLNIVLAEIKDRLETALNMRIAPRAVYNRLGPPDLTGAAHDDNWHQPLLMLQSAAAILRKELVDNYFPRRFSNLSFTPDEFRTACDIFGDLIVKERVLDRAKNELAEIEKIAADIMPTKEKCQTIWTLIKGKSVMQKEHK